MLYNIRINVSLVGLVSDNFNKKLSVVTNPLRPKKMSRVILESTNFELFMMQFDEGNLQQRIQNLVEATQDELALHRHKKSDVFCVYVFDIIEFPSSGSSLFVIDIDESQRHRMVLTSGDERVPIPFDTAIQQAATLPKRMYFSIMYVESAQDITFTTLRIGSVYGDPMAYVRILQALQFRLDNRPSMETTSLTMVMPRIGVRVYNIHKTKKRTHTRTHATCGSTEKE